MSIIYSAMSDAAIDSAYADAVSRKDYAAMSAIGNEIGNRLQSVGHFFGGIFGAKAFPFYESRTGFSQSQAAQSSLGDSASRVAAGIGAGMFAGIWPLLLGGIVLAVVVYQIKK